MPVESAAVAVALHQFAEIAQIAAELFRREGGIFPTFPPGRLSRHVGDGSQGRFAHLPDPLRLLPIRKQAHLRRICTLAESAHEIARLRLRLGGSVCAELGKQPTTTCRQKSN